jgi:hypothetical protein
MKLCQFAPRGVAMADSSRVALTSSKRPKCQAPANAGLRHCKKLGPAKFEVNLEEA